jgi:hypothetical protein
LEGVRRPTVPLEAGIGPENPPCPACGEPLFGWVTAGSEPVRRCEACGLGVIGEVGDAAEALRALERRRMAGSATPRYLIDNRSSVQASLGEKGWVAIEPGACYLFTPEAVRRLVSDRGQVVAGVHWRPGPSVVRMWGTMLNSFTWGRNVALGAIGRAQPAPAAKRWQRAMDTTISILATPLVLVAALLSETAAGLVGRGGVLELTLRPR